VTKKDIFACCACALAPGNDIEMDANRDKLVLLISTIPNNTPTRTPVTEFQLRFSEKARDRTR
jgi:hypothetical protein